MKKKLLSTLLVICMLCTLLPMSVLAATPAENEIKLELVKDSTTFTGKDVLRVDFKYKSGTDIPNNQMVYLKYDANKLYPAAQGNGADASSAATNFSTNKSNTFTKNNFAKDDGFGGSENSEVMLYTIIKGGFGYVCWKVTEPNDTPAFADFTRISSIFFGLKDGVTFDKLPKDIIKLATPADDKGVTAQTNIISITVNGGGKDGALMYGSETASNNNLNVDLDKLFVAGDGVKFASSTPATYKVSFDANGGSGTMADVPNISGNYALPTCTFTAPSGQQFKGWATSASGAVITGTSITVSADTTLYAIWEPIPVTTYTVSFNANGGSGTMADVPNISGNYALPTCTFTAPSGQQFKGWATSASGAVITGTSITVSADTTLYAIWEPIPVTEYTITFNVNGGIGTIPPQTTSGQKLSSLPTATHSGSYSFVGWYDAISGGNQITTAYTFSADTTVYAHWTYIGGSVGVGSYTPSYTVSVDKTENGTITVSPKSASKGSIVTITVKPDKGYTLETLRALDMSGYAMELTENNGRFTFKMPASAVIVKATFMDDNTMLNFFVDVKASDYFYDAVLWAAEKGVTSGADALHFSPNAPCTRAQIVTFLGRAAGSPAPKNMSSFVDVPADAFYAKAVAWAVENGITGGTGDGKFSPDATCTRAQAVTFFYRASGAPAVSGNAAFSDVATNAYYAAAVKWAEKNGITGGIGGGLFGSGNDCTRAQIVTFLYRSVK